MYTSRKLSPFEVGFWGEAGSALIVFIGPLFIVFGVYLLCCLWPNYQMLAQSAHWKVAEAVLNNVQIAQYNRSNWEIIPTFFEGSHLSYSFNDGAVSHLGTTSLNPQGPRFYNGMNDLQNSGDSMSANRIQARYAGRFTSAPAKTPMEAAAPFKLPSLAGDRAIAVRYDPDHPANSILADVVQEHQNRISGWAFGSIAIGGGIVLLQLFLAKLNTVAKSDDKEIEDLYDKLNAKSSRLRS